MLKIDYFSCFPSNGHILTGVKKKDNDVWRYKKMVLEGSERTIAYRTRPQTRYPESHFIIRIHYAYAQRKYS